MLGFARATCACLMRQQRARSQRLTSGPEGDHERERQAGPVHPCTTCGFARSANCIEMQLEVHRGL